MEFSALNWPITAHTHSEIIKRQIGLEKVNLKAFLTTDWLARGMNCFFDPTFCYYQVNAIDFNFQTGRKNISMGIKTNLSTELSTEEGDNLGSRVLTTWCVVFSVEAALIISGNLYALAVIITGYFDLVRYFTVSLAVTEITRGLTALVIALGLRHSDKLGFRVDHRELFQTLQTLCDVFSLCFLAAISLDMYYRTFWPLHKFTRVRCYMTTNFLIWIFSMAITMTYAFSLAGFYQLLIADVVVWFVEIIDLTIIFTNYILIWLKPRCTRNRSPSWRLEKQNFELSKAFSLCAITYLAVWLPVQILQGISHFTWSFPRNAILFMEFLKILCSFVCPVIYYIKLLPLHKSCTCRCTLIRHKHSSIILPDSLPVITLKSATSLMTALWLNCKSNRFTPFLQQNSVRHDKNKNNWIRIDERLLSYVRRNSPEKHAKEYVHCSQSVIWFGSGLRTNFLLWDSNSDFSWSRRGSFFLVH